MRAGLLKHTITLQRGTQTVSESGSVSNRWTDYATIRAELVPVLADIPVLPAAAGPSAAILGAARRALDAVAGQSGHPK